MYQVVPAKHSECFCWCSRLWWSQIWIYELQFWKGHQSVKNLRYGLVDLPILVTADSNTAVDNLVKAITNFAARVFSQKHFLVCKLYEAEQMSQVQRVYLMQESLLSNLYFSPFHITDLALVLYLFAGSSPDASSEFWGAGHRQDGSEHCACWTA